MDDSTAPVFMLDKVNHFRCPRKIADSESTAWLEIYGHYKSGFLPVTGGIYDQSSLFLKIIEVIKMEEFDIGEKIKNKNRNRA